MATYQEQAVEERKYLLKYFKFNFNGIKKENILFTNVDGFDYYDAKVYFNNVKYIYEIKVRNVDYKTCMLEQKKMDHLLELQDKKGCELYYISAHPSFFAVFNLNNYKRDEIKWVQEYHWKSSTERWKGKELKWVTYLPTKEATILNYDNNSENVENWFFINNI